MYHLYAHKNKNLPFILWESAKKEHRKHFILSKIGNHGMTSNLNRSVNYSTRYEKYFSYLAFFNSGPKISRNPDYVYGYFVSR